MKKHEQEIFPKPTEKTSSSPTTITSPQNSFNSTVQLLAVMTGSPVEIKQNKELPLIWIVTFQIWAKMRPVFKYRMESKVKVSKVFFPQDMPT